MSATIHVVTRAHGLTLIDRAAAAFLLILMAVGSLALWIGVPAGWLWLAGQITAEPAQHILVSILGFPFAMIAWARFLFWLNRLHARVTMGRELLEEDEEEEDEEEEERRWLHGPLEPLLVGSFLIALGALFYWFFVLAEDPGAWVF